MINNLEGKKVLVTGANGMIGKSLVELLRRKGAYVHPTDLPTDLRERSICQEACKGMDIVMHLAGIKGSPQSAKEQPARYFVPMLQFNTNMMEAAKDAGVEWYLYTSSVGVYEQAEVLTEDDVWKTFPSENDTFPAWAKRMGELQAQAYSIEYDWNKTSIVRPANVYGIYDNFGEHSMVIPSLIKKASKNNVLHVWGDGSPIRDLIYSEDVALGMIHMVENQVTEPVNIASGTGVSIKNIAEIIAEYFGKEICWDTSKPMGDMKRLMDTSRAESYGFKPRTPLKEGIIKTIEWYLEKESE
jgi:GDP-L-fucose synthase